MHSVISPDAIMPLAFPTYKRHNKIAIQWQVIMVTRLKAEFMEAIEPRPKTPTQFEHRLRSLALTDALIAVEWLNAAKGTSARVRVLQIRDDLEQLGGMLDSLHRQRREGRAKRKGKTTLSEADQKEAAQYGELYTQFREGHNKLNEDLSAYSFCPVMVHDVAAGVWRYNAVPRKSRGLQIEITHQGVTVQVNEATVVAALARLAANGEFHKVRLCEQCKEKWRISEREIDRFCSARCRDESYHTRPKFKKLRRKIQKDYRDREKRKDAMAKADVRDRRPERRRN